MAKQHKEFVAKTEVPAFGKLLWFCIAVLTIALGVLAIVTTLIE